MCNARKWFAPTKFTRNHVNGTRRPTKAKKKLLGKELKNCERERESEMLSTNEASNIHAASVVVACTVEMDKFQRRIRSQRYYSNSHKRMHSTIKSHIPFASNCLLFEIENARRTANERPRGTTALYCIVHTKHT